MVPRTDRRQPLPHRRHLVANRNWSDDDYAATRHHRDQARIGDPCVPRHSRGIGGRRWQRRVLRVSGGCARGTGASGNRRLPRPHPSVALDVARHLRRPRTLQAGVLVALPGPLLRGRRSEAGRGRLLLAPGARGRRDARRRAQHLDDGGRIGSGGPPRRCRGRRHRQETRPERPGDRRIRAVACRPCGIGCFGEGTQGPRGDQDRSNRPARRCDHLG